MLNSKNEWHGQGLPRIIIEGKEEKDERLKKEKAEMRTDKKRGRAKGKTTSQKTKKARTSLEHGNVVMCTEAQESSAESSSSPLVLVMSTEKKRKKIQTPVKSMRKPTWNMSKL